MGIRNQKRETHKRLDSKTLDAKLLQEIQHGHHADHGKYVMSAKYLN